VRRVTMLTFAIAALVALPAASGIAGDGNGKGQAKNIAAKLCKAEKKADRAAFKETYGPKHAMRNCKKGTIDEVRNAAQECREERAADADAFRETYGTNEPRGENSQGGKKNAFGKCVKTKVQAADDEE
jgi:hypothetical protein